jgi:hypothetical protein
MSRFSGAEDSYDNAGYLWEKTVELALRGKKGRVALEELRAALLALPRKRLVTGTLCNDAADVCALGALGVYRRVQLGDHPAEAYQFVWDHQPKYSDGELIDDDLWSTMDFAQQELGLTRALADAVSYQNDEGIYAARPEWLYDRMLEWVEMRLRQPALERPKRRVRHAKAVTSSSALGGSKLESTPTDSGAQQPELL